MDNLQERLDSLAMRLNMEPHMIDPVEFGEIKGAVASLQQQMTDIKARQTSIDGKLDIIVSQLAHARGGWKMLMALGGGAGTLGAFIGTVLGRGSP